MIAAMSENGVIGDDEGIPWYIPEDTKQYKKRIEGEVVVYGSGTFSPEKRKIPPSRHQIILTRSNRTTERESSTYVSDVEEAIHLAEEMGVEELFILGGGEIYTEFLPIADRMILSEIHGEYEGTVYFPEWDAADWIEIERDNREEFDIVHYERQ